MQKMVALDLDDTQEENKYTKEEQESINNFYRQAGIKREEE